MNLLTELRKRNVFRVLAAYLVGAWIIMQVIGFVAGASNLPEWADTLVLVLVLAGLPIVGIAAWALELTPEGVKSTGSTDDMAPKPIGPVDYVLIASVVAVVGLFGWQQFAAPAPVQVTVATEETQQGQSIAVMPFVAISEAPEDVILGDGLAEELLNVLAQFPDLRVAGRTSSFSFRDRPEDITGIGEALGVSHVLEGSVRRSGEQIRVTAQLIRVADGFHIWSGNYDRPFTDILEVQDEIVHRLAQVLTVRLGIGATARTNVRTSIPAAYEQYLRGRYLWAERLDIINRANAIVAFQTAVDIDPDFAAAQAALARALIYSDPAEGTTLGDRGRSIRETFERALALDPNNAEALVAQAAWHQYYSRDWAGAQAAIDRALELAPQAAFVHYEATYLYRVIGDRARTLSSSRRAMALDPLNKTIRSNIVQHYINMEMLAEAERLIESTGFGPVGNAFLRWELALQRRDADAMEAAWPVLADAVAQNSGSQFITDRDSEYFALRIAAARGDVETVRVGLPTVAVYMEEGDLYPRALSDLQYSIGDYAAATEGLLPILSADEVFDREDIFTTFEDVEIGARCQPAFHAIWELPGMSELAEIRRANRATGNLPLSGPECDEWQVEAAE